MIKYESFDDETKKYYEVAINIYATIKEKKIVKSIKSSNNSFRDYELTNQDKKIFSLFTAGLLAEGKLKEILEDYNNIKINDLFTFVTTTVDEVKPLESGKYAEYFEQNFLIEIESLINTKEKYTLIKKMTPLTIFSCMNQVTPNGSKVLNYFSDEYKLGLLFFSMDHQLFKAVDIYCIKNGIIQKKNDSSTKQSKSLNNEKVGSEKFDDENTFDIDTILKDNKIWQIMEDIQNKFIGQEEAVENIFYNIINNQQLVNIEGIPDDQRSLAFLDGSTGTGKTAMIKEIGDKLGIPFVSSSITNYSASGYVGGDLTDLLKDLYNKSNGDLNKAQRGIISLDEFEKIATADGRDLVMKVAVQHQLLDFLGGGKYKINLSDTVFSKEEIEFDTSKITFICLGALTNLRSKKTEKEKSYGFNSGNSENSITKGTYDIKPEDLIDMGLERELVGRFNTYLHTKDYSEDNLKKILKESTISPLIGLKKIIESKGKELNIDNEAYDIIAKQAYELNTGARSLQTIINNIRTPLLKEILRGESPIINLDAETVENIWKSTMTREVRK